MDELWRQWPKDRRILVSNKGRIVSCRQSHCRELSIFINDSGYQQTSAGLEGLHPGHHYPVEIVETGEQFDSQIECAKALHSTKSNISKAVLGKVKKHKGFTIRRVEES